MDNDNPNQMINKSDRIKSIYDKYITPYLNISEVKEFTEASTYNSVGGKNYMYYFSDGTAFKVSSYNTDGIYYYTENPEKCEQRTQSLGVCIFRFSIHPYPCDAHWKTVCNKGVEPIKYDWDGVDMNFLRLRCSLAESADYCATIIQLNGWKIPDDYPFKF